MDSKQAKVVFTMAMAVLLAGVLAGCKGTREVHGIQTFADEKVHEEYLSRNGAVAYWKGLAAAMKAGRNTAAPQSEAKRVFAEAYRYVGGFSMLMAGQGGSVAGMAVSWGDVADAAVQLENADRALVANMMRDVYRAAANNIRRRGRCDGCAEVISDFDEWADAWGEIGQ